MENYLFKNKFERIVSNLFILLSKINISVEFLLKLSSPLFVFIRSENILNSNDLKIIGKFIENNPSIFDQSQYQILLRHSILNLRYDSNKYNRIIKSLCLGFKKQFPEQFIDDKSLVPKAIANTMNTKGDFDTASTMYLVLIINEECKNELLKKINHQLLNNFDPTYFFTLLKYDIIKFNEFDLDIYIEYVSRFSCDTLILEEGKYDFKNTVLINFIYLLYSYNVFLSSEQLSRFKNIGSFENWALNPKAFNYEFFIVDWLLPMNQDYIIEQLALIPEIKIGLENKLRTNFNSELAEIYFKYF